MLGEDMDYSEFKSSKIPMMRITYTGTSVRSKVYRSMWIFNKLTFSSQKYNIPLRVEVEKGESEVMTIALGVGIGISLAIGQGFFSEFGAEMYHYMKKKILEQLKKHYSSKIKVETNNAWAELKGLRRIDSEEIYLENNEEPKPKKQLHA